MPFDSRQLPTPYGFRGTVRCDRGLRQGGEDDGEGVGAFEAGCVPPSGVGAVGKWPAGALAESLAQAGPLTHSGGHPGGHRGGSG